MDRWTIKQLNSMSDLEFAAAILNERRNKVTPYSPLGIKLASVAHTLLDLAALKQPQTLVVELPEGMTQPEREELADALHDVRQEWAEEDRSVGIFPMPQRELNIVAKLEEALRNG
ncbi:hypothetical protein [Clostridium sp. D33t1_170424_F3]|uniref:hypothetical protein n=1 Tax=Clostridium sp. D33t1_170424_F3 TaxID=2787099 RepID=UPI0018A8EE16|nr:hypothetical protein [Clostridium sp. D33t1_170424_F3]